MPESTNNLAGALRLFTNTCRYCASSLLILGLVAHSAAVAESGDSTTLPELRVTQPATLTLQQPTIVTAPPIRHTQETPADTPPAIAEETPTSEEDEEPEPEIALVPEHSGEPTADVGARELIAHAGQCRQAASSRLRKTLLFTAFPRRPEINGNAGKFRQIESQLPDLLARHLLNDHALSTQALIPESLPTMPPEQLAQTLQKLAGKHHAQIIVSGEILSTDLQRPEDIYHPRLGARVRHGVLDRFSLVSPHDTRHRQFTFNLSLHDGATGARILERRYHTTGLWNARPASDITLESRHLQDTDYGQAVSRLLTEASAELAELIQCQPHMIVVEPQPRSHQAVLQGGTNQGLRVGDHVQLYQVTKRPGRQYGVFHTTLIPTGQTAEIDAVYQTHSVVQMPGHSLFSGHYVALINVDPAEIAQR